MELKLEISAFPKYVVLPEHPKKWFFYFDNLSNLNYEISRNLREINYERSTFRSAKLLIFLSTWGVEKIKMIHLYLTCFINSG